MTKFVIDTYDKYWPPDKENSRFIFHISGQEWAIKEYKYIDGQLMRPLRIDEPDNMNQYFYLYDTLEEAKNFVKIMKSTAQH